MAERGLVGEPSLFAVDEQLERALEVAWAQLGRRDLTVAELRSQLERRGVAADAAERALSALAEQGYLDDERFARAYVSDKRMLAGWGSERIRRGLLSRGIDPELAEAALTVEDRPPDLAEAALTADDRPPDLAEAALRAEDRRQDAAGGALPRVGSSGRPGSGHASEVRRALALLEARHPGPFLDDRDRGRALGLLLRRGYESEVAYEAVRAHTGDDRG